MVNPKKNTIEDGYGKNREDWSRALAQSTRRLDTQGNETICGCRSDIYTHLSCTWISQNLFGRRSKQERIPRRRKWYADDDVAWSEGPTNLMVDIILLEELNHSGDQTNCGFCTLLIVWIHLLICCCFLLRLSHFKDLPVEAFHLRKLLPIDAFLRLWARFWSINILPLASISQINLPQLVRNEGHDGMVAARRKVYENWQFEADSWLLDRIKIWIEH